jgi:PAS domain S-box-containing protein
MNVQRNKLIRLAWMPVAALLLAMIALWLTDPHISFESYFLVLVLNFLFSTLASLYIAYLIGRSFLARGSLGLLLLGCGVVTWGAAGVMANVVSQGDPNLDVTIHNLGVLLSALFHLAGAIFLVRSQPAVHVSAPWLSAAYVSAVGAVGLIALLAVHGYTPTFFVPGEGGSLLRQCVLGSSIGMFLLTALLAGSQKQGSAFTYWYTLALIAIAVGLLGILLQSTIGGLLPWVRAALCVGGVYMLLAALASVREAKIWGIPLEESLRQAAARLTEVFESISDGFIGVDAHWRYTYVNSAAERIFGKHSSELLGKNVLEVFPEALGTSAYQALHKVKTERAFVEFEDYNPAMQRWFRNRAFAAPDGGITIYFHDITDRKQAEAQLQKNEEALREADRRKDEFLATLAHELRNPLAPVRNAVQVLRMKTPASPELEWARDVIDRQIQHMTRLIDDLLDVSRISRGKVELRREPVELATIIQGAVETSRPVIQEHGQELIVSLPPEAVVLNADLTRLAQVISNLLHNAPSTASVAGASI